MSRIFAKLYEDWYEDNYEDGEVSNNHGCVLIETKEFDTASEAMEYFKKQYENEEFGCEHYGDNMIVFPKGMMDSGDYGWEPLTKEKEKLWKAGKINLWNVEYQLFLFKIDPLPDEETKDLV